MQKSKDSNGFRLTPDQAFACIGIFLDDFFSSRYQFDDYPNFFLMIGEVQCNLSGDEKGIREFYCPDEGYMEVWDEIACRLLECDLAVLESNRATPIIDLKLSFQAMTLLIASYRDEYSYSDHNVFFTELEIGEDNLPGNTEAWLAFETAAKDAENGVRARDFFQK